MWYAYLNILLTHFKHCLIVWPMDCGDLKYWNEFLAFGSVLAYKFVILNRICIGASYALYRSIIVSFFTNHYSRDSSHAFILGDMCRYASRYDVCVCVMKDKNFVVYWLQKIIFCSNLFLSSGTRTVLSPKPQQAVWWRYACVVNTDEPSAWQGFCFTLQASLQCIRAPRCDYWIDYFDRSPLKALSTSLRKDASPIFLRLNPQRPIGFPSAPKRTHAAKFHSTSPG